MKIIGKIETSKNLKPILVKTDDTIESIKIVDFDEALDNSLVSLEDYENYNVLSKFVAKLWLDKNYDEFISTFDKLFNSNLYNDYINFIDYIKDDDRYLKAKTKGTTLDYLTILFREFCLKLPNGDEGKLEDIHNWCFIDIE